MTTPNDDQDFFDTEGAPPELGTPVPKWLKVVYTILPFWGMLWLYLFWNGSDNTWFDRGGWTQLQQAAKTTWNSSNTPP
ncbi:MAG: hypothetical protein Q8K75_11165 [Chlamydiales bacterium]|nr:hypothetical protein [Chlamydiales bacterium]